MTSDPDEAYDDRPDREDRFNAACERYVRENREELLTEWFADVGYAPREKDLMEIAALKVEKLFQEGGCDD
jgi:hypothetical protein